MFAQQNVPLHAKQIARCRRVLLVVVFGAMTLTLGQASGWQSDSRIALQETQEFDSADVAQLVDRLNSEHYLVRRQAEERLTVLGMDSVGTLAQMLDAEQPETAWRARESLLNIAGTVDSPLHLEQLLLILDIANSRGEGLVLPGNAKLRQQFAKSRAEKIFQDLQQRKGIALSRYPIFQQRVLGGGQAFANPPVVIQRGNGVIQIQEVVPRNQIDPQQNGSVEVGVPVAESARQYLRENFRQLTRDILASESAETLEEIRQQLRDRQVYLPQSDAMGVNPGFGIVVTLGNDVQQDTLEKLQSLMVNAPSQLVLQEMDLTQERFEWLTQTLKRHPPATMSMERCLITLDQLKVIEENLDAVDRRLDMTGRAMLGVRASSLSPAGERSPAVITQVTPGSGSDRAGIMAGDVIRAVDGLEIRNFDHLRRVIACYAPGDVVKITVQRPNRIPDEPAEKKDDRLELDVELTDYAI